MKKKILSLLMAATLVVGMTGCVQKPGSEGSDSKDGDKGGKGGYELALITDVGTIDDKSFNQGTWEGLEKYAKDNNLTHKYYKPTEKSDEACLNAIDLAVKGGAKVIATPGFLFEYPIMEAQTKYPDVSFILVDAEPKDKDGNVQIEDNVMSIMYAEEQAASFLLIMETAISGILSTVAVTSRSAYSFLSAGARLPDCPITLTPVLFTTSKNSSLVRVVRSPGIDSSLSTVPPVCPRPRPDIFATFAPHAATIGAMISVVLSPTPPVECLSTLVPSIPERSTISPE